VELGELGHRGDEARAVELRDLAGIALGECGGARVGLVELGVDAGVALPVDERGEVPLDRVELGIGGRCRGAG
jgi:hypothetical protein